MVKIYPHALEKRQKIDALIYEAFGLTTDEIAVVQAAL